MLAQTSLITSLVYQPLIDKRYKSQPTLVENLFEITALAMYLTIYLIILILTVVDYTGCPI
jgi:hypothetical protein